MNWKPLIKMFSVSTMCTTINFISKLKEIKKKQYKFSVEISIVFRTIFKTLSQTEVNLIVSLP